MSGLNISKIVDLLEPRDRKDSYLNRVGSSRVSPGTAGAILHSGGPCHRTAPNPFG